MSSSQNQTTKNDILRHRMIAYAFKGAPDWRFIPPVGDTEYDTVASYCAHENINIAEYAAVKNAYGDDFGCRDIARVSHITSRNLKLEGKWYRTRCNAFIGFGAEDSHPIICVPSGLRHMYAYDLYKKEHYCITHKTVKKLRDEGVVFYRPLPTKSLTRKEVIKYGLSYVSRVDIVNVFFMTLFITLIGLLMPILNEQLFDKLIPMGSYTAILQIGLVILATSIGNIFFTLVKNFASFRGLANAEYAITDATLERLYHLPQSFIDRFGSIDLVSRALGIMNTFESVSSTAMTAVLGALLSLFYLVRMFKKSGKLSWAALIMMGITILITIICARLRIPSEKELIKENCEANDTLYGEISGISKIRISCMEDRALYDYQLHNARAIQHGLKSTKINNVYKAFTAAMSLVYSIVFYYLIVKKGIDITIGQISGFTSAFGMFNSAIMQLVDFYVSLPSIMPAVERAMPIYETPVEEYEVGGIVDKFSGKIDVEHLSFAYDPAEKNVLEDISFSINPGEFVGIVGHSGCGKSTLFKLLLGFEKPVEGKIYYDDKDLETIDKLDLRRQMGVVLQDGKLIMGSIYENVALAKPDITEERVKELLKEAGFGYDLDRMPMGVYTMVSEFGSSISGGQQQRILIARALANDPTMLLFDESTSALDNKAQETLCSTLEKRNMTRISIAHRLITVKNCDKILVMDRGRIVEQGTYDELVDAGGLFAEMAKKQSME